MLFSSHLLEEVEQVADHVTMISRGRIALSAPLDVIRESHRSLSTRRFVAHVGKAAAPGEDAVDHALARCRDRLGVSTPASYWGLAAVTVYLVGPRHDQASGSGGRDRASLTSMRNGSSPSW